MPDQGIASKLKSLFKPMAARAIRPGIMPLADRLDRIEDVLEITKEDRFKYESELAYWRYLVKEGGSQKDFGNSFEIVFGHWQRNRLLKLAEFLGVPGDAESNGIDDWCASRTVIEIGAGPFPAAGAARKGWKKAIAVDPIARGYVEGGLVPVCCDHIVYVESKGERIPLPSGYADLIINENCLDHVTNPRAVVKEMVRLLKPGGLLWFFVDLSNHIDQMHPHAMNEQKVRKLLVEIGGFTILRDEVSSHKAHPQAYGGFRGLLQRGSPMAERGPSAANAQVPEVHIRGWPQDHHHHAGENGTPNGVAKPAAETAHQTG